MFRSTILNGIYSPLLIISKITLLIVTIWPLASAHISFCTRHLLLNLTDSHFTRVCVYVVCVRAFVFLLVIVVDLKKSDVTYYDM